MNKHQNLFDWIRPNVGTICFPKLKTEIGAEEFCDKVVTSAGIMVILSSVYDYGDRHIRVGFGRENFLEVLNAFDKFFIDRSFSLMSLTLRGRVEKRAKTKYEIYYRQSH